MGVPRFYRYLQNRCPQIYTKITWNNSVQDAIYALKSVSDDVPNDTGRATDAVPLHKQILDKKLYGDSKPHWLYIDMNGLFHTTAQFTFCYDRFASRQPTSEPTISQFFHQVTKTIDQLCELVQPEVLYLAVDGVCPRAKQQQQRYRRFAGLVSNPISALKTSNEYMQKAGFSSAMLSPGTPLMAQLHKHLKAYTETKAALFHGLFYSSHEVAGEGEHKIVKTMRVMMKDIPAFSKKNHVVFGLDADYFMLTMATRLPNVYLMRDDPFDNMIHVVSIDRVKKHLYQQMAKGPADTKPAVKDFHTVIDDFIFLSMFVGNDFLKSLAGWEDLFETLDFSLLCYTQIDTSLTQNQQLNCEMVKQFLKVLQQYQVKSLETALCKKYIEPDPAIEASRRARIQPGETAGRMMIESVHYDTWRKAYYQSRFRWDVDNPADQIKIQDLCQTYLEGLMWNVAYYLKGCPSWTWYYPYQHSPVMQDVIAAPAKTFQFVEGKADPFYVQLLCILPKKYKEFIPKPYDRVMEDSRLQHMYPESVRADYRGCVVDWHCTYDLSFADHDSVTKICATLKK